MPINFIAVLDHQHLDNSVFLTAFAKSLAQLGDRKGIVIHGDSPYTDRLIQTGMMREDARIRAIKDLNKRLIGLFADQGIPTIGVHGFQKELISLQNQQVTLNHQVLNELHHTPNLLISNLIDDHGSPKHVPLPSFAKALSDAIEEVEILLFSMDEKEEILVSSEQKELTWQQLSAEFIENSLPNEFHDFNETIQLTTATDFANWPNLKKTTKIS